MPRHNEDGVGGMHLYMPWWIDNKKLDFPRGYHIEFGGGLRMPDYGFMGGVFTDTMEWTGPREVGAMVSSSRMIIAGFMAPSSASPGEENYVKIDPNVVDQFGIPVLRFHVKWSEHEYLQVKHMQETFREIIDTLGGTPLTPMPTREEEYGISTPGEIIHEVGVTRMGHDPGTSVLNKYCQAHDVKNVFVADGGPFVSQADKNPTWTILALAMRTGDYIIEETRKGNL